MTYLDSDLCEAGSLETHEGKRVCPDETFLFKIKGYIEFLLKTKQKTFLPLFESRNNRKLTHCFFI